MTKSVKAKTKPEKRVLQKAGRKTKYQKTYNEQARKLCLLGYTDMQLADFFEVNESTINKWKKDFPSFSKSLKMGKDIADANVAASLYERATGYSHKETKIATNEGMITDSQEFVKHYAPCPVSIQFWLHNRQKNNWRKNVEAEDDKCDAKPMTISFNVAPAVKEVKVTNA